MLQLVDAALAAQTSEKAVAAAALGLGVRAMGVRLGNLQLIDWMDGAELRIAANCGFDEAFLAGFASVTTRDPCACGRALLLRRPVIVDDVMADEGFASLRPFANQSGFRSVASIPLLSTGGALLGVISVHADEPSSFGDSEVKTLRTIALGAADALIRVRAYGPGDARA
jgi:GAF domain-containing protein